MTRYVDRDAGLLLLLDYRRRVCALTEICNRAIRLQMRDGCSAETAVAVEGVLLFDALHELEADFARAVALATVATGDVVQ